MEKFWEVRHLSGHVVHGEQLEITPEARAVIVRWPKGGMVWTRPVGVRLVAPRGRTTAYQPIYDLTRRWQLAFYGLALGFTLWGYKAGRRSKRGRG
jgi:hypothetical protein